tara:strand:+ start:69 stop:413 length:345 start_codon:yes stop_codon:yes gene_type:complete
MKITKVKLKELIKEEISGLFEEEGEIPPDKQPAIVRQFLDRVAKLLDPLIAQMDDVREIIPVLDGLYKMIHNHAKNETDYLDSEKKIVARDMVQTWRKNLMAKPEDTDEPKLDL